MGEYLHMNFPIAIATLPFRIPNAKEPKLHYGKQVQSTVVQTGEFLTEISCIIPYLLCEFFIEKQTERKFDVKDVISCRHIALFLNTLFSVHLLLLYNS